jgi:hypothetical protein
MTHRPLRHSPLHARRGVASVLSMMFLVIFGSLAAVMAVVAQGNLRTADSALKVSRAMSAAETGLIFAKRRLESEGRRFVIKKGVIDQDYAEQLWLGTYDEGDGEVLVLDAEGYEEESLPNGLAQAVLHAHVADAHAFEAELSDGSLPELSNDGVLLTKPIKLDDDSGAPYFRLKYEIDEDEPYVRVISQGVDGVITRTLTMAFRINKRIEYAVISPSRIMIGKNVLIEGPLGTRYGMVDGELDSENGDPLVMRSDFYYLSDDLDASLDSFFAAIVDYDADNDGRLRPNHPSEGAALEALDAEDIDGDEYVDDFDLFMSAFDDNADAMIVYDSDMAAAAGLGMMGAEFDADLQLTRLIDKGNPDRNGDGVIDSIDTGLGYNDGVIDANDQYAKVRGRLAFAVPRVDWDTANEASYQTIVEGAIRPPKDKAAAAFEVDDTELREITTDMFASSHTWFKSQASGEFADQAAGGDVTLKEDAPYEKSPYGSENAYDYYQRPIYKNITFTNVKIPMGTNALFEDCTFVGVTYIETTSACDDVNWNYTGALAEDPSNPGEYITKFEETFVTNDDGTTISDTRAYSNNLRFHNCTFLGSISGDTPTEYTHWRNKIQITGQSRFFIDADDPDLATQPDASDIKSQLNSISADDLVEMTKSSMLLPGWSVDVGSFSNETAEEPGETPTVNLRGVIVAGILDVRGTADVFGTLLMTFRPEEGAGPLFYGGKPEVFNTTIGYFGPADGDGEGVDPDDAAFEGFGEIRLRYNPDALLPDGIPWPITVEPAPNTYVEGGSI